MAEPIPVTTDPADQVEQPVPVKSVDAAIAELAGITDQKARKAFYDAHPELHRIYSAGNFH